MGILFWWELDLGIYIWNSPYFDQYLVISGKDHDETEQGRDRPPDYFDLEVFFNLKSETKIANVSTFLSPGCLSLLAHCATADIVSQSSILRSSPVTKGFKRFQIRNLNQRQMKYMLPGL